MSDLVLDLQRKLQELEVSIKQLRKSGTEYAEAERQYKVKLSQVALKLRSSDMAVGMIDKVIYGTEEVADLRFKRDVCQTIYKANLEHINATKLYIKIIENQIEREWSHDMSD